MTALLLTSFVNLAVIYSSPWASVSSFANTKITAHALWIFSVQGARLRVLTMYCLIPHFTRWASHGLLGKEGKPITKKWNHLLKFTWLVSGRACIASRKTGHGACVLNCPALAGYSYLKGWPWGLGRMGQGQWLIALSPPVPDSAIQEKSYLRKEML